MSKKRNLANEIKEGFDALARIRELEAEVLKVKEQAKHDDEADKWHKEYLNASKDAMTFAGQLEKTLEDAWQRVSYGKVDFTTEDFKNSMMFDFPRYDWSELRDLIKGVKR